MKKTVALLTLGLTCALAPAWADNKAIAVDEMEAYLEFVDYNGATIFPEQIPKAEYSKMTIIDTRDAAQFAKEHIPGAVNIEWRQVLAQSAKIPKDKMVLLYCNAGTLSSQAGFALRIAGWDNVRILQGGINEWKAKGGLDANARAAGVQPAH